MHLKIIRVSLRDLGEMSAECLLEMYACLALINQFPKAVIFSSAFWGNVDEVGLYLVTAAVSKILTYNTAILPT